VTLSILDIITFHPKGSDFAGHITQMIIKAEAVATDKKEVMPAICKTPAGGGK